MLQPMGVINTEIHTTYIFIFSLRLFLNSTIEDFRSDELQGTANLINWKKK